MSYDTCEKVSLECPVQATTYGYYPNLGGNIFFAAFYGVLGCLQLGFGVYFRAWTLTVAMAIGAFMELAGYIGRIQMHYNPWNEGAFKLQIVCLVLAPTFVAAGIYLTLKHIVLSLGPQYSRLRPGLFTWIFISCDIGSLVLQAAGGGVAAAAGKTDRTLLQVGDDIIIAGIAFQVATMSVCGLIALDFFVRVIRHGPGLRGDLNVEGVRHIRLVIYAEVFAYFTVLIRCIYRIPEMAGGWGNPLMQKEDEFLVLDGMMIALGIGALTLVYPAFFLPSMRKGLKKEKA